jgi:threonine dehydratase
MLDRYVKKIHDARIYDLAIETPIIAAPLISSLLRNEILIKREDLQSVFSFKVRGAYNKLLNLSKDELERGVIAASAGNHAQGVAQAASKMEVEATIVMPTTTPQIKVDAVRQRGAQVVLVGDDFDAAAAHASELRRKHGAVFIHPFDDPDIIAGQGTIGMEIHRQLSGPLDAVFVAVGGGGLCAGISAYLKKFRPETKIIAVESDDAACFKAAMDSGERVRLSQVGIFADGTAVRQVGEATFAVMRETVDQVITVTTDEICAAIKDTFNDTRAICEPSGAMSLAGLKKYVAKTGAEGQRLLVIQCGANVDFDRLRYISERTETGEKKEAILAVTIDEKPGSFRSFCSALQFRNVTEFNYRYNNESAAQVFVGVEVSSDEDRYSFTNHLSEMGYRAEDLTDNEMAKLHIRHMVGGRSQEIAEEQVFRFDFPERPGALLNFLNVLGDRWNITMFHYRNHGSAFGRVLVAFQATAQEDGPITQFLDSLGYRYVNETQNRSYQLFLRRT